MLQFRQHPASDPSNAAAKCWHHRRMGFFGRRKDVKPKREQPPAPPAPPPRSIQDGASWMSENDWSTRLAAYQRQGRSDAEIRQIITHLEKRGPRKPRTRAESAARAQSLGIVSRSEYMDEETEARALTPGADGLPSARLQRERDRLLVVTSLGWVNPKSRTSYRYGLYSFGVRGTGYHEAAAKAGRFTPGTAVRLVREPNNSHDTNAIAICSARSSKVVGYVPKGQARRLAKLLDAGTDLVAVSVRGSAAGTSNVAPHVLVCERTLYEHLTR